MDIEEVGSELLNHNSADMDRVTQFLQNIGDFNEKEIRQFKEAISDAKLNRVLGSIFGSMIADALGSYCEFRKAIPEQLAEKAMEMPGGGTFVNILPGQYTDDNEMAYHLLQGLCRFNEKEQFSQQKSNILKKIGLQYVRWVESDPFDIGNTCSAAIYILRDHKHFLEANNQANTEQMSKIYASIYEANKDRESNGSLMRITPMAAFVALLQLDVVKDKEFIINEIKLTHPNVQLTKAGMSWVHLLSQVIHRKSDDQNQFKRIFQTLEKEENYKGLADWFKEARREQAKSMPAAHNMGWAKIAWSYGFKFLHLLASGQKLDQGGDLYRKWIKWVIGRAGDTDTNAAISGGLIGAVIGFRQLPIQYLEKIFKLQYINKKPNTSRPRDYEPSNFLRGVLKLIQKCKLYREAHKIPV